MKHIKLFEQFIGIDESKKEITKYRCTSQEIESKT